jgi:hypothetical protein
MAAAAAFFLSGCGGFGDTSRQFVAVEGAEAYDEGLENAEWLICQAASVGSVQRRYGRSAGLADAWRMLCLGDAEADILGAPPE